MYSFRAYVLVLARACDEKQSTRVLEEKQHRKLQKLADRPTNFHFIVVEGSLPLDKIDESIGKWLLLQVFELTPEQLTGD